MRQGFAGIRGRDSKEKLFGHREECTDSRRRSVVADTNINFNPNININTSGRGQECPPYGVLLGEADLLDQGCVAGIGVEGVEAEVGAEGRDPEVVFLAGDVEPFEGMIAVAKFRV